MAKLYNHPEHILERFRKYSAHLYIKDSTLYTPANIRLLLDIIEENKKYGIKSRTNIWVTDQLYYIDNDYTFEDYIESHLPTVMTYENNKEVLGDIYDYQTFKELAEIIDEISSTEKIISTNKDLGLLFEDKQFGYRFFMPRTIEASRKLGIGTTWCTSGRRSANLFLTYTAKHRPKNTLFYCIKINGNPRKNPNDKICIGFVNGKPLFEKIITVNARNELFTEVDFARVLGPENAEKLLKIFSIEDSRLTEPQSYDDLKRIALDITEFNKEAIFEDEQMLNFLDLFTPLGEGDVILSPEVAQKIYEIYYKYITVVKDGKEYIRHLFKSYSWRLMDNYFFGFHQLFSIIKITKISGDFKVILERDDYDQYSEQEIRNIISETIAYIESEEMIGKDVLLKTLFLNKTIPQDIVYEEIFKLRKAKETDYDFEHSLAKAVNDPLLKSYKSLSVFKYFNFT